MNVVSKCDMRNFIEGGKKLKTLNLFWTKNCFEMNRAERYFPDGKMLSKTKRRDILLDKK